MTPVYPAISRHVGSLAITKGFGGGASAGGIRYSLLGGSPAPEALPVAGLAAVASEVLARGDAARVSLNYSDAQGNAALRQWLAEREGVDARRIVIVNGALHGISLLCRALLDPGDLVVVEDPTFIVTIRALQLENARVERFAIGPNGFDVGRLRDELRGGLRPRLVYVIPDFQNPTGKVLSSGERAELVSLAEEYGFILLWDNPYRDSRFAGEQQDDVSTESAHVVKVNTFSKSLGPGLRLGWLVLPEFLVEPVLNVRRRTDQQPPTFVQSLVTGLVTAPGFFDDTLEKIRQLHKARSTALVDGLSRHSGGALGFERPEGGFFLWVTVADPDIDPVVLERTALQKGILYVGGHQFAAPGTGDFARAIRLGFTNSTPEQLSAVAEELGQLLQNVRKLEPA